jgi:hypothetical protein
MRVTFETEVLPDGSTIRRRFEEGRLDGVTQSWVHPSGRRTAVRFDGNNNKVAELHNVGSNIVVMMAFKAESKTSETYICNRRLATRKTYEEMRAAYPDMPPADTTMHDANAELVARTLDAARYPDDGQHDEYAEVD